MAATLAHTITNPARGSSIRKHTLVWVSHTDGAVNLPTPQPVVGEILRVVFKPSAAAAPTAAYDVTLQDADGAEILGGQGANLHETNITHVCPGVPLKDGTTTSVIPVVVSGLLNLTVANAGSGKGGTVILYVR